MLNTMFRPGGLWEYEMFTEILTVTRYPEKKKFALINSIAPLSIQKVPDDDGGLARLIDKAARNLLLRVEAQGWEPVDAFDADSLWARGRVRYGEVPSLWDRAVDNRKIELTTVSIFCRRWVK